MGRSKFTFADLWIEGIVELCKKGNWKKAVENAKIGLDWSKEELIEQVQVEEWKVELEKVLVFPTTMG